MASDQTLPAAQRRADLAGPYAVIQLNRAALSAQLALAPNENDANKAARPVVVSLPLPDGRFSRFRIEESPILSTELAAALPDIKTYRGSSLDDPTAMVRIDVTPAGFHAFVLAAGGTVYVDPYTPGDLVNHVSYDKTSLRRRNARFRDVVEGATDRFPFYSELPIVNGTVLRTYRLALAATAQYVEAAGSQSAALARMVTSVNRVDAIYERELAVRLTLITGTAASPLALLSADDSDYDNGDGTLMLTQNQFRIDAIIGTANYDIGHVFSTGGGGIANLESVCAATVKARGVTGLPDPVGDAFDVDFVAHEMGHQFGANHTFNGTTGNCVSSNRSPAHAYEVGSGSTIMAYAGICPVQPAPGARFENTQLHSDDLFNFESLNEITAFITSGNGSSCGVPTATGNTLPSVTTAPGFTIPRQTPFTLTAAANDGNSDALTYIWEEHDLGSASFDAASASTDAGNRPLFRSYVPTTSPSRMFPSLSYILNNANVPPQSYPCSDSELCLTGEVLPSLGRTMSFAVTVRDNRAGGGGVVTAATMVTVDPTVGPFAVASPNGAATWPGGSTQTVTWNVSGANALAANVRISLSTNGGLTFPITLLSSTPNDGSESIVVPNVTATTTARVKVEAVGNIFFDIGDANFTIVAGTGARGDVAIDFGPVYGLWLRDNPTGPAPLWMPIHGLSPSVMTAGDIDGNGKSDLIADFPGYGVWAWMNNTSWVLLNPADADHIVAADLDGNGQADVVLSFPAFGLWVFYNNTSWTRLHPMAPSSLAAGNVDGDASDKADVIANFPGYGVWSYMNNASWIQLHPGNATDIQTGDLDGNGQDEIVLNFPGLGIWVRVNNTAWFQLHAQNAAGISIGNLDGDAGGRKDVIVNFPGAGVWAYMNNTTWTQLHPFNASTMAVTDLDANSQDDLILSFPGLGVWVRMNNAGFEQLHPLDAEALVGGRFDDN